MRALLLTALVACVPSAPELRAPVERVVHARAPELAGAVNVDQLLAQPLDRGAAVRIAIANSPRLAAAYDALGVAAGELAGALGLGPLEIDGKLRFGSPGELEVDAIQNVLGLIAAPRLRAAARGDLESARAEAAAATLRLAARVEIAFDDLTGARQELELRQTAFDAADAAATLRERMRAAGNATDLAQARDRDAREQARVDLARAEAAIEVARTRIDALLGLSGSRTKWTATGTLAGLPAAPPALDELEATAVGASLELAADRARRDAAANRASGERLRTVLPEVGIGASVFDDGHQTGLGPAVRIGIPLLDFRSGERARANALIDRSTHELTAHAVELRAAARAARITALATYEEARHIRDVILPLRQQIVDETLKHYNAMDADPFALVVARRDLVEAGHQYLDALRRYANAMAEVTALQRGAMVGDPL